MNPTRSPRPLAIDSPAVLDQVPHLALLDVIDHALHVASWAIFAEFPALAGDPHPWRPDPPNQLAARRLLRQMTTFQRALQRHHRTTLTALALAASEGDPKAYSLDASCRGDFDDPHPTQDTVSQS